MDLFLFSFFEGFLRHQIVDGSICFNTKDELLCANNLRHRRLPASA